MVPLIALVAGGCGGSTPKSSASSKSTTVRPPTVDSSTNRLGEILVDSKGRTVYLFKKDKGTKSACIGPCANAWPPVRANSKPTVSGDAKASKVATTTRSDGAPQVTYNGHPLYRYQNDDKPSDATGQGVNAWGGRWFALTPAGKQSAGKGPKPSSGGGY